MLRINDLNLNEDINIYFVINHELPIGFANINHDDISLNIFLNILLLFILILLLNNEYVTIL
jgi:hypothetical protein